jgi:CYTH domain-containing protein
MSAKNNGFNWTDSVTLKYYFEKLMEEFTKANNERLRELEERTLLQFKLNQTALDKAETATNIRLANMNEFRDSLKDQAANFLTKDDYEVKHELLANKIDSLEKIIYMGLGAVGIIEFIFKFFVK